MDGGDLLASFVSPLVWSVRSMEWLLNEFDTAGKNRHFNHLDASCGGRMEKFLIYCLVVISRI
jgi:hypothetical protein